MSIARLKGGRVYDPANGVDGEQRDVYIRDGRIVDAPADGAVDRDYDAQGMIVMAGGIDLHSHIGGGKTNLSRLLLPEDHRDDAPRDASYEAVQDERGRYLRMPSCGVCTPGTLATGYRYAEMGYTAAFEPAMIASNARHAHLEMGDTPIIDHGAYVMLGNDELLLQMLAAKDDFERVRDYVGWTMHASRALGVKVVNPGGISAFKFNQRSLDVDEAHTHYGITPRDVLRTLTRALTELRVPHPLHVHASNLGVPGNIDSTIATMDAADGLPIHLTHIQFHSYGTEGPRKFSSGARAIAEAVNARPNVSIDVGQIIFGQTVTASGDTMMQFKNAPLARPHKWIVGDIECDAGCGIVPFRYREQSYVNALQWIIGLEIFLLVDDPWRVSMTTDHPNGGPFTSYPHLIRLLMDKPFRDAQIDQLHPEAKVASALPELTREFSLYDIAIITRAGPARLLGLKDRGHLAPGAAADIAVYRDDADRERMFTSPAYVFKDGELVARDGNLVSTPTGGIHFVSPDYDRSIEKTLRQYSEANLATNFAHAAISDDEICACCRGGRLLPVACLARA
ncbi:formylmethanofuran dehydrogenase, subunit A /formyltransferase/hydrolase complex subunit A [Burkholderia sp. YR290]|jgi:formylmethanofuran dehydrogenase subunit A|uniref:formylmethanofuran dehydrogenase subunit A n=1 Tax=Paraburkholderia hospita TaxID=169430 RepID=UPI0009A81C9F|nr:formylmethanofuran dehydrogenase subunit A [Paraburkholderia hospita]SKD00665.1 formylmethanofuran dehydrogenase, subunit A /formyltransferase/hydrolase complex subunit A [Burkholderia sp. CF099]SKD01489.1 formylmethanofuran dehydrogenase, subunit A /formyltransferase/hydrolase complex subunit A [Paraburkholderia hospita]SOE83942.1 formylmethanofuran dehydrogenase, subunit A /formyltransferase/hydrolase complex subunit A [Burkholderia sp. YR290]